MHDRLIGEMRSRHADGRLSLFVGAGVSMSQGLPGWTELVRSVVEETWIDDFKDKESAKKYWGDVMKQGELRAMSLAKPFYSKKGFKKKVHECLYRNWEGPGCPGEAEALAIAQLRNVKEVCCLNYDDILEDAYRQEGKNYVSLTREAAFPKDNDVVVIYHPHGFLPRSGGDQGSEDEGIIMAEEAYYLESADLYSWTNLVQLKMFLSSSVLFVGFSFSDPNTRRLLFLANNVKLLQQHYAIVIESKTDALTDTEKIANFFTDAHFRRIGVKSLVIQDFDAIPGILRRINGH